MRTLEAAAPSRSKIGLRHERSAAPRADASAGMPRPSWSALIIATAVVAGITWGIARQRTNEIDPRQVIAVNLTAAKLAIEDARFVEPAEHSAAYYYRMVLAIDPTNEAARAGLNAVAEELLAVAKSAILSGRFADAVEAIDHTRRIAPEHRRIPFVEAELRKALEAHAASVKLQREPQGQSQSRSTEASHDTKNETPHSYEQRSSELVPAAITRNARDADLVESDSRDVNHRAHNNRTSSDSSSSLDLSALSQGREPVVTPVAPPRPTDTLRERQYVAIDTAYQLAHSALDVPAIPVATQTESPPITVSAERVAPKIVTLIEPEYPKAARVRGIEGWVDLTLSVAAAGNVIAARVEESKGTRSFERAALSAVRQWRYEATSDTTTPQDVPVRVEFRLER